jgi:hypothetical protein
LLAPFDLPTVLSNVGYQGKSGSDWNIVKLPRITLGDIHVSRMTALPTAGFADPLLWNVGGRLALNIKGESPSFVTTAGADAFRSATPAKKRAVY